MKPYAVNKRAKFDYNILEKFQAGLVLLGHEVKAIKTNKASLKASFVNFLNNELWLLNANIAPYQPKNTPPDYDSERSRKLLLKKSEIKSLIGKLKQKGLTLVALKLYNNKGKIKLEFGIGKGRKKHDKRELIKKRQAKRKMFRVLRGSE
ncbi:SsrA-binding protein [bacterium]|nr:SsrA-binding protein [bacterium]